MVFLGMILGFIVFKERKLLYPKKIQAIVNIHHPRIHNKFKYLMGWHIFIKNFVAIMAPKMTRKPKIFFCTKECLKAWELIKKTYIEAPILISQNWQVEFHVHMSQPHFGQV
jgi:hypothetical protein